MKYGVHAGCTHFNSLWDLGVSLVGFRRAVFSLVDLWIQGRFAGPKCRRELQAVMVIASTRAITLDWLSSSKFGSARLTSQTVLITAEMIMVWTMEV
jgi:hypothetical protein